MLNYTIRRAIFAVPTVFFVSFIIFAILDLAPSDPTANIPLYVPPEVRQQIRESFGLGDPFLVRYALWVKQFFIYEPINIFESLSGFEIAGSEDRLRVTSWSTRAPVVDLIIERLPQTLWVVGLSYAVGMIIAIPVGVYSAYRQYSWFDQIGTFFTLIGYSVPSFFIGIILIVVFAVNLEWFPSVYDTTHKVYNLETFWFQIKQMILPVMVLAAYNASQLARFMRASMLESLNQDYIRTSRAKGMSEMTVVLVHAMRNSLIPIVTVIALSIPQIFSGAIITEQIFRVNGMGALLIQGIQSADIPLVQTLTFIFAVLIVLFNLIADVLYGLLDPRIRHD